MDFLRHLWRVFIGAAPAVSSSSAPAARTAQQPPRKWYILREELELALLVPWLPEAERPRAVGRLGLNAGKHYPWTRADLLDEPREQCQQWGPLEIQEPELLSVEGWCGLLEVELTAGLCTFCTTLDELSRPVRMLWLLRQGRRAAQVYAGLEAALGSRQRALEYARSVIAGL